MISNIKSNASKQLVNLIGWKTNYKIIVFESDDWGAIRMPSKSKYDYLLKKGYPVDKSIYDKYDRIESNDDLEKLFNVLDKYCDTLGNPPTFTLNNIVANPDFEKIKRSGYQSYYFKSFTKTLNEYSNTNRVVSLYKEGIKNKFIKPQFHGREHINVTNWLKALGTKDKIYTIPFELGISNMKYYEKSNNRTQFLDTFGNVNETQDYDLKIKEGIKLFREIHGYFPDSFIAPCYIWAHSLNEILCKNGIKYLQGGRVQKVPINNLMSKNWIKSRNYTGKINTLSQVYTVRNVFFECSSNQNIDWVNECLAGISNAFKFKTPAIISTHRVNYIGTLNENNRDESLKKLDLLLFLILKKWPNVIFLSSDQLAYQIRDSKLNLS